MGQISWDEWGDRMAVGGAFELLAALTMPEGANVSLRLPTLRGFRAYVASAIDRITFQEFGEARAAQTLRRAGYRILPSKLEHGEGMDIVAVKDGAGGTLMDIIVDEAKARANGRATLSTATIDQMRASADAGVRQTGNLLYANRGLIRTKANVLDVYGVNRWNRITLPPR